MHHNKIFVSKTIHLPNNNTTKMEVLFKSIYMFQHLRKHQIIPNVIYFQYAKVCELSTSISIFKLLCKYSDLVCSYDGNILDLTGSYP